MKSQNHWIWAGKEPFFLYLQLCWLFSRQPTCVRLYYFFDLFILYCLFVLLGRHTYLKVKEFYGSMGVDFWGKERSFLSFRDLMCVAQMLNNYHKLFQVENRIRRESRPSHDGSNFCGCFEPCFLFSIPT